jgi:hemerythrin-like domain-containing protein
MDGNSKATTEPQPTGERVETWEMVVIHKMFRRELRDAAALVRGVAGGDRARAELVGDHLDLITTALHDHHHGEDLLLWPRLLSRVGTLNSDLVNRMESQHEVVAGMLEKTSTLLPAWRSSADTSTRDELASVLEQVFTALDEHLGEEEREILPLVSIYVTQAEWDALGEHGKSSIPKGNKGFIALGGILEDATPSERDRFLGLLPAPVRLIYRLFGANVYRRHKARLAA